jgi:hypothetical protein
VFLVCSPPVSPAAAAVAEVELMKERFAKLLLGDDMSGGAKGVCTALAISNAITNLSGNAEKHFQCTSTSQPLKD